METYCGGRGGKKATHTKKKPPRKEIITRLEHGNRVRRLSYSSFNVLFMTYSCFLNLPARYMKKYKSESCCNIHKYLFKCINFSV